jgi:putative colanic acid biosysnthesis UDP-glucose lipid carrier transferase
MIKKRTSSSIRKASGIAIARDNILYAAESLLGPSVMVFALWAIALYKMGDLTPPYFILSIIMFSFSFPSGDRIGKKPWVIIAKIILFWILLASSLLLFGEITGYIDLFPRNTIILWLWLTPVCQILAMFVLRAIAPVLIKLQGPTKNAVVAGLNEQGVAIAESLLSSEYSTTKCLGFFDDRTPDRLNNENNFPIVGGLADIADYVKQNNVSVIYLSLPMSNQPRIIKLLDDLKDTTVSIYFLPDIFLTDLIQGRMGQVDGIPVVAVCETPFMGFDGMLKRLSDIVFATIILILISPILLIIGIGVKLSSPGPVIFKQKRYGLDGQEILVYKFRSMTTQDNGSTVVQATKNDMRITPLGAILRKTSLDELPQFINVLQGRMSVVGPRPHAVAHNEMYRKIIKGYMIRHKAKPGITGWAQVNGLRGETDTLDKMQARVDYDLDYLRNWSLRLDTFIIFRTLWVVIHGQDSAY